MEILVRIAHDKYFRNGICETDTEAFRKLLNDHLLPVISKNDSNKWRWEKYVCEDVDLTLKAHLPVLKALFSRYSGRKTLPGYKPFMCLEEFRDLCTSAGLLNDSFASREIDACFGLAMMTYVDELFKK